MRLGLQISVAIGLAFVSTIVGCGKKQGNAQTPTPGGVVSPTTPNQLAEGVWSDLVSGEQPRVVAAWKTLASTDAAALRRASYTVDAPPNDELHLGSLAIKMDTSTLKSWDKAFAQAFPGVNGEAAVRACAALDQLGAGVMDCGPTFANLAPGVRPFAYDQAILVRMFALKKLSAMDHGLPQDPKETLAKLQEIARSGKVAQQVP